MLAWPLVLFMLIGEPSVDVGESCADAVMVAFQGVEVDSVGEVRGQELVALLLQPPTVRRQLGQFRRTGGEPFVERGLDLLDERLVLRLRDRDLLVAVGDKLLGNPITTLMDRSLVIVNNELEGTGENGGDPSLTDDEQQPVMPEYAASSVRATASKAGIALSNLFRHKEGTALVRLLADPTATQPGPLADAITVWVKALRMLLIEIPATEGRGDDEIADTLHEATRNAETILAHALGQAPLQIGTAGHLPR